MNVNERCRLELGDCLEVLKTLPDDSVDSVVTDPPYLISFMGSKWDTDKGNIAADPKFWAEVLRVLKPGGYLLAFGATRTYHRMTCAIEGAGFSIRDSIHWTFGSGWPKGIDVSKAIDGYLQQGRSDSIALREVNETRPGEADTRPSTLNGHRGYVGAEDEGPSEKRDEPSTPEAKQWDGWNSSLKPGHEPIVMARKPLRELTIAAQVLKTGTGALNIDACRIAGQPRATGTVALHRDSSGVNGIYGLDKRLDRNQTYDANLPNGRWPTNWVMTHSADCQCVGTRKVRDGGGGVAPHKDPGVIAGNHSGFHEVAGERTRARFNYIGPDGTEEIEKWDCVEGCPVAEMDRQSGTLTSGSKSGHRNEPKTKNAFGKFELRDEAPSEGDSGGASRFFPVTSWEPEDFAVFRYVAKASRSDRGEGNNHPTVKPKSLMIWLTSLVTQPGGTVLDPFLGSGTTGVAALQAGFQFIGIEKEEEYFGIAKERIENYNKPAVKPPKAPKGPDAEELIGGSILDLF